MAKTAAGTIKLRLDLADLVADLHGLASAIEATQHGTQRDVAVDPITSDRPIPNGSLTDYGQGATPFGLTISEDGEVLNWLGENYVRQTPEVMREPHSRACGIRPHEHGPLCHSNCPTCGGQVQP